MTLRKEFAGFLEERLRPSPVNVPGFSDGCASVRLLTDSQMSEARIAAFKHVESVCKEAGISIVALDDVDPEAIERERQVQMVYRAFVDGDSDPEDPKLAFRSASQVRDLDAVTIDVLFDTYIAFQMSRIARAELDNDSIDELLVGLRDEGSEGLLATVDAHTLRTILVNIARRG